MVTFVSSNVDNVVAAVPILIFAISPTASRSASVNVFVLSVTDADEAEAPPVNASISS